MLFGNILTTREVLTSERLPRPLELVERTNFADDKKSNL